MSNIGMGALLAPPIRFRPRPLPAAYHPLIQIAHLYGGHFFTPRGLPGPPPMPESHSP